MHAIDYYGAALNAYKSALHIHSINSDGQYTPQAVIALYASQGFDALAFTDHRTTNPVSTYDGRGMTLLSGIEIHPNGPRGIVWHFLAVGVPEDFQHPSPEDAQAAVDAAKAAGAAVFCAHPYWCGLTSAEVAAIRNLDGVEVYNSSCRPIGRAFNMQTWDELSDMGLVYPALAVDDTHSALHLFQGWTYILAEDKSPAALLAALKAGRLYASQGPVITRLSFQDGVFEADFSPCTEVIGLTNPSRGYGVAFADKEGPCTGTQELTTVRIPLLKDGKRRWFRLQLKDAQGHYAWTAPIVYQG